MGDTRLAQENTYPMPTSADYPRGNEERLVNTVLTGRTYREEEKESTPWRVPSNYSTAYSCSRKSEYIPSCLLDARKYDAVICKNVLRSWKKNYF